MTDVVRTTELVHYLDEQTVRHSLSTPESYDVDAAERDAFADVRKYVDQHTYNDARYIGQRLLDFHTVMCDSAEKSRAESSEYAHIGDERNASQSLQKAHTIERIAQSFNYLIKEIGVDAHTA